MRRTIFSGMPFIARSLRYDCGFSAEARNHLVSPLLRDRLKDSINRRIPLLKAGRACRLVFAEADLLPSIIVDRYGDFLVLQTLSRGSENLKTLLVDILRELIEPLWHSGT